MSDQNQNQPRHNQPPDHEGTGYASHPLAGTATAPVEPELPSTVVAGQVGLSPAGSTGHAGTGSASHPLAGAAPTAGADEDPETERGGGVAHSSSRINEDEDGTGS